MQLYTQQSYRSPRKNELKCPAHFGPFSNSSSPYLHMYLEDAGIVPENQATRWGGQGSNCSRRILRDTNPILESQPWWNVDVKGYLKGGCQKNDPVSCALSSIFGPASKIKTKSKNDIWNRIWATNGTSVKKKTWLSQHFFGNSGCTRPSNHATNRWFLWRSMKWPSQPRKWSVWTSRRNR